MANLFFDELHDAFPCCFATFYTLQTKNTIKQRVEQELVQDLTTYDDQRYYAQEKKS